MFLRQMTQKRYTEQLGVNKWTELRSVAIILTTKEFSLGRKKRDSCTTKSLF